MARFGYARVSRDSQDATAQRQALESAGCSVIAEETASGGRWDRPKLHALIEQLSPSDELVVWKLDRLSRSMRDLLLILEKVAAKGAAFRSLTESIETTSPAGIMLLQMLGAFAQFERSMIAERTKAGLRAARKKGLKLGRRLALDDQQRAMIVAQIESGAWTAADAARITKVSPATISRELARRRLMST